MGGVNSTFRLVAMTLVIMAVAAFAIAENSGTSHGGPIDVTGLTCMDLYIDIEPLQAKGEPHGVEDDRTGKILSRIEPSKLQSGAWDITSVSYNGPGALIPTKPPSTDACDVEGDGNTLNGAVPFQDVDGSDRPTATAMLVTKAWRRTWSGRSASLSQTC